MLLTRALVESVRDSLLLGSWDEMNLRKHCETVQDSVALRGALAEKNLIAFIADGSRLPRRSGADDRPARADVVHFEAPESMRVTLDTPFSGPVRGMGIAEGVTLIVGGGYHGKSTLLRAIERGYLDHIPGDGREAVVALEDAVKIRAEDGRSVVRRISPLLSQIFHRVMTPVLFRPQTEVALRPRLQLYLKLWRRGLAHSYWTRTPAPQIS